MTIMFDYDRLLAVPSLGDERATGLENAVLGINAAGWSSDTDFGHLTGRIVNGADFLRATVADVRRMIAALQAMLEQAHRDGWEMGVFKTPGDFVVLCAAAAGLVDQAVLDPELREVLTSVESIMVDREWMESKSAEFRARWLALLSVRWLPLVNASGAFNSISGVLRGFIRIHAIGPNTFASVVDAEILCDIAMGLDEALHPGEYHQRNVASARWRKFFEHQQALARKNRSWDRASWDLWSDAEQLASRRGNQWAIERGAHPSDDVAVMALLSEVYRWINKQHGTDSDPIRLIASGEALATGISAKIIRDDLYRLFDPHNPDFTYRCVVAIHELVARGELVLPSPEKLRRGWRDMRSIPTSWDEIENIPFVGPILRELVNPRRDTMVNPQPVPSSPGGGGPVGTPRPLPGHLTAEEYAELAKLEREMLDRLKPPIIVGNRLRDAACERTPFDPPACK